MPVGKARALPARAVLVSLARCAAHRPDCDGTSLRGPVLARVAVGTTRSGSAIAQRRAVRIFMNARARSRRSKTIAQRTDSAHLTTVMAHRWHIRRRPVVSAFIGAPALTSHDAPPTSTVDRLEPDFQAGYARSILVTRSTVFAEVSGGLGHPRTRRRSREFGRQERNGSSMTPASSSRVSEIPWVTSSPDSDQHHLHETRTHIALVVEFLSRKRLFRSPRLQGHDRRRHVDAPRRGSRRDRRARALSCERRRHDGDDISVSGGMQK